VPLVSAIRAIFNRSLNSVLHLLQARLMFHCVSSDAADDLPACLFEGLQR